MLNSDFQKLSVIGLTTLYTLDATPLGAGILRWHGHIGHEDWQRIYQTVDSDKWRADSSAITADKAYDISTTDTQIYRNIIWQGNIYTPVAIQSDGLEMRSDGKASTPSLVIANNIDGLQGAVSALCAQYDDFAGAKLTVTRVLAKYLDADNFTNGNPSANPTQYIEQHWYIEQKTQETAAQVTFELSNPVDYHRQKLPARNITSYCNWAVCGKYRGEECGYTGTAMYTKQGIPTVNPDEDQCGGRLVDCKLRFGEFEPLSFGGFPSANLMSR